LGLGFAAFTFGLSADGFFMVLPLATRAPF
jgi:hypothetical protein